jgi:hypothetical protein
MKTKLLYLPDFSEKKRGIRKCFFSFFFLFFYTNGICQEIGQIVSKNTNTEIPFATIFFKKNNIGVHSNQNGVFEISSTIFKDSMEIRALGYKPVVYLFDRSKEQTKFYLEEEPILLPAVVINKVKNIAQKWKGSTLNQSNFIFGQMGSTELREIALYIPNDEKKEGYLSEASFYIARFGKHRTPFRIHFYEPNVNNMPGKELLTQNLIFNAKRANDYYTVDVSNLNIPFGEGGIFVSMEWLNLNDKRYFYEVTYPNAKSKRVFYGQQVGLTNEFDEDKRGRRRISNGEWKMMNGFSAPMFKVKIDFFN